MILREPSSEHIDILCPVIPKDLPKLKLCSETWKKYVYPKVDSVMLVGPRSDGLVNYANSEGFLFFDEDEYLGGAVLESLRHIRVDKRGWIKQQLIKLSCNGGTNDNVLVIDADVFLMRPHVFLERSGKPCFFVNGTHWDVADKLCENLLPKSYEVPFSFVTDKMLFNREHLDKVKNDIEANSGKAWYEAIAMGYDNESTIGFSEFELYGRSFYGAFFSDTEKLVRVKWEDSLSYDFVKKRYFVYDQVTFY